MNAATVINAPVNRGIAVAEYENAAAFTRSHALFHLHDHHLDGDDPVVDEQAPAR